MSVESRVLPLLRPTRLQLRLLYGLYSTVARVLEPCLAERGVSARATLQGSYAKGTLLRDKWEIDVFLVIEGVTREWLESIAEPLLRGCLRGRLPFVVKYSQHPYVTVPLMGMEADVVPIGSTPTGMVGLGVERTPLHTEYVRRKLAPHQRDEVRLLKSFLKGVGVYGAETRVRGFSGYLAELLVIVYGSFRRVLEAASEWRPPIYIDPEGTGDFSLLRRRYRDSPIIVVDPVDPARNAAAAVSEESLATFILASRLYLERPHEWFFHAAQPREPLGPPLPASLLRVECRGRLEDEPPDSVWGRLVRAARSLEKWLRGQGFTVLSTSTGTDEYSRAWISLLLESCRLPRAEPAPGPPALAGLERITRFIEKRIREGGHVWLAGGRLVGARPRPAYRRSAALAALAWLSSQGAAPLHSMGLDCSVKCEKCGEGVRECSPTPAWIAAPFTARKR